MTQGHPTGAYLAGLRLAGLRVVVVGAGSVAQRRLSALLGAGAKVTVIAPQVTPAIEAMIGAGELTWVSRGFQPGDLAGAWYVLAVTNVPSVNEQVAAEAEASQTFCVRADLAASGTAVTPASGEQSGYRVGVVSARRADATTHEETRPYDPRRLAGIRDAILEGLRDGRLAAAATPSDRGMGADLLGLSGGTPAPGAGQVVLVGGGPGDPDLISVRGRRLLAVADVVVADRLGPRALLNELAPQAEVIDAAKLPRGRFMPQEEINQALVEHALKGKLVVRLKGGDSFIFGRGWEEVQACVAAGVPVSVVPGISSASSVPALAGIPLTHRGVAHETVIVSGHVPPDDPRSLVNWRALAQLSGTIVVLMGMQSLPDIVAALVTYGRDPQTPVAVISDGSMPTERRLHATLATVGDAVDATGIGAPAIIVVGEVAGLMPALERHSSVN